ncbi:MAG TPA: hypothetical protein VGW31_06925 [Hanamia sp.]|jgi:vacuolar-type H+-ATPase subunit E/Vma4|nr:hypothetical protein [Hanamia sp.]
MTITENKDALFDIVKEADEKLTRLLIALANEYNNAKESYSKEELKFFNNRRKVFFDSGKKGSSVEDAHSRIRRNYHNGL